MKKRYLAAAQEYFEMLKEIIMDPLDLTPGEGEIRNQVWSANCRDDNGLKQDWPSIYKAELDYVDKSTVPAELAAMLRNLTKDEATYWAATDAKGYGVWKSAAEEALEKSEPVAIRATLRGALCAQQAFYARLRQATYYRGKVLLLSLASLLAAVLSLVAFIYSLRDQQALTGLQGVQLALLAGWVGAAFTWMLANRKAVDTSAFMVLREISRWPYTISRGAIGSVSAMVLFIAMSAGVLPNPADKLLRTELTSDEWTAATDTFRTLAAASTVPAGATKDAELAKATAAFAKDVQRAFLPVAGQAPFWTRTDQEWLAASGFPRAEASAAVSPTYTIREKLRRQSNAFWLLLFICLVAGFSETLAPSLLDKSVGTIKT